MSFLHKYSANECMAAFVEEMNHKAVSLGANNSHFVDPFGGKNISTAHDLARIMLNASGYDRLYDIWNTPVRTLRLIQKDGSVRECTVKSTVVNGAKSHVLGDAYHVMGGKTGTLLSPDIFNLVCICQSKKCPDDWYIISALKAETSDKGERHRFQAVKDVMDLIEAKYDEANKKDALDKIAWENLSYRDIFEKNNLAPKINPPNMPGQIGSYKIYSGDPEVVVNDTNTDHCGTAYSLKCFGEVSQQLASAHAYSNYPYFVAANVKIERYVSGCCGVMLAKNFAACHSSLTNGWVVSAGILRDRDTRGSDAPTRIFVGSGKRANLDGYVAMPVVIPMNLFKRPPSEKKMTELYRVYSQKAAELHAKKRLDDARVSAESVYALKKPVHTGRAYRYIEMDPVYEKNSAQKVKSASTTKVLTSLVLLDYISDLNEKVLITQEDLDAVKLKSSVPLFDGESITYLDLLYAIYLSSSNEACCIAAHYVGQRILESKNC